MKPEEEERLDAMIGRAFTRYNRAAESLSGARHRLSECEENIKRAAASVGRWKAEDGKLLIDGDIHELTWPTPAEITNTLKAIAEHEAEVRTARADLKRFDINPNHLKP